MIYAKENHKEVYEAIVANKVFLASLQKVDQNWCELINNFIEQRQNIFNDLKKKQIKVSKKGKFLWIGNQGIGDSSEQYNLIRNELLKDKYLSISHELGLKNTNEPELFK